MNFKNQALQLLLRNGIGIQCSGSFVNTFFLKRRIDCRFSHNVAFDSLPKIPRTFGQPTPESHPHLLKSGELVPGFGLKEFVERRSRLAKSVLATNPKACHVVLIPSTTTKYMTDKIPYFFRQNTDFRYLTGCLEPDSALLMLITPDTSCETTLFVREKNNHSELWEGPRTGVENAPQFFGVDRAKPISGLLSELCSIHKSLQKMVFWYDYTSPVSYYVHETMAAFLSESGIKELTEVRTKLHELRLKKSKSEQTLLRESAEIASRGIEEAMATTKPGLTEHQLFATVDYYCRMHSAEHLAYPPVVATGNNANIIHYIANTQQIKDGDLILMDAGCELHGYSSDITRTWPATGKFSEYQRILYEIVLRTQLDLIRKCSQKPVTLDQLFEHMCNLLGKLLRETHVLTQRGKDLKVNDLGFQLCPHHVGHYLGMDIHDTETIKRSVPLEEGMLITIEPGIYVKQGCELMKPEFHGMGIRIEDNVLITSSGCEVISNAVKDPSEVEAICQSTNDK